MFSKEEYWKNRKAGKRGQGEYPKTVADARVTTPGNFVSNGGSMINVNRAAARQKSPSDPQLTKRSK
jgi:hypothetical protein